VVSTFAITVCRGSCSLPLRCGARGVVGALPICQRQPRVRFPLLCNASRMSAAHAILVLTRSPCLVFLLAADGEGCAHTIACVRFCGTCPFGRLAARKQLAFAVTMRPGCNCLPFEAEVTHRVRGALAVTVRSSLRRLPFDKRVAHGVVSASAIVVPAGSGGLPLSSTASSLRDASAILMRACG
jgi:hypothetical protein